MLSEKSSNVQRKPATSSKERVGEKDDDERVGMRGKQAERDADTMEVDEKMVDQPGRHLTSVAVYRAESTLRPAPPLPLSVNKPNLSQPAQPPSI